MIYHQSNIFSKIFQILFIVGSTFLIFHSGVPQQFLVVFLVIFLCIWRPKKSFPLNLVSFYQRFMALAWRHPLITVFDSENSFHLSGANSRVFSICYPESINSGVFFLSFQLSFSNLTGASFKWSLFGLWSPRSHVSKSSQASSFIL